MSEESKEALIIYTSAKGKIHIDIHLDKETLWLSQAQIAEIFDTDRTSISRHLNNIFKTGELAEKSNVQNLHTPKSDRPVKFYSLDTIISVGYRVNSKQATKFRIWASGILKQYLTKGYAIDEKKLLSLYKTQLKELKSVVDFLSNKTLSALPLEKDREIISFIQRYTKSLKILEEYDQGEFELVDFNTPGFHFTIENCQKIIETLREEIIQKNPYNNLFGVDVHNKLPVIIELLNQTFETNELYKSLEEKAAHLLYLVIKDHPFLDGNKRIATILFMYYLKENQVLFDKSGREKFSENALATLSLLIAESKPLEKDVMIKLIARLIQE